MDTADRNQAFADVFSENAWCSIPTAVITLDSIINELNQVVNINNEATEDDSLQVTGNIGTITLPFFGDSIDIDYETSFGSGSNEKIGYKINESVETVIVSNIYDYTWTEYSNTPTTDYTIFYATRDTSTKTFSIKFALFGENRNDSSTLKQLVYQINGNYNTYQFDFKAAY